MSLEWRRLFEWEKSQVVELHQGLAIVTVNGDREDQWRWELDSTGSFNVKVAYQALHMDTVGSQPNEPTDVWKNLWGVKAQPKALFLVWRDVMERDAFFVEAVKNPYLIIASFLVAKSWIYGKHAIHGFMCQRF